MGRGLRGDGRGRLILALILTLGPTLALGYFGYRTVVDRERSLRVTYSTAAVLLRDRLVTELRALEHSLMADVAHGPGTDDVRTIQAWLPPLVSRHPVINDAFVVRLDGGSITPQLSFEWARETEIDDWAARTADSAALMVQQGEIAEARDGDPALALRHYQSALATARSARIKALAQFRIARAEARLGDVGAAARSYRSLADKYQAERDAHGVPYVVWALDSLVDISGRLRATDTATATEAARELQEYLAAHPWDAADGYGFYLRRAMAHGVPRDLESRLDQILAAVRHSEWIEQDVRARLRDSVVFSMTQVRPMAVSRGDEAVVLGLIPVQIPSENPATRAAVGLVYRSSYIRDTLLPRVVAGVNLGRDIRVSVTADDVPAPTAPLASVSVGDALPGWNVTLLDPEGRSIQQLTSRERWVYGGLVGGMLAVLVVGVVFTTRAWARQAELAKLQNDFVSSVSHELKTPLALIRMFGETLESGVVGDPNKRQEFYGIIRRESERLTHLINNVLDTARIEAGTKQYALEQTDLVTLVRDVLDAYMPLFSRLDFSVEASLPASGIPVVIDRDAVAQALVNLFQNAIRYSGDGKQVQVLVTERDTEVTVAVADRGVGIPADELTRVFDRFYRGKDAHQSGTSAGSGLGLSIVKHVMAAHGGRVDVQSTEGKGSTFTLIFPRAQWTAGSASQVAS